LAGLPLGFLTFAGFGFYGLYVFWSPSVSSSSNIASDASPWRHGAAASSYELVIRVVHVDGQGKVLDRGKMSPEGADKISTCIAEAL
jgi:hypothetical protein